MAGDSTQFGRIHAPLTVAGIGRMGSTPITDGDRRARAVSVARWGPIVDGSADHA